MCLMNELLLNIFIKYTAQLLLMLKEIQMIKAVRALSKYKL